MATDEDGGGVDAGSGVSYATLEDFFRNGLPAEACVATTRTLSAIYPGPPSLFQLAGHGLFDGYGFRFVPIGTGAELPAGASPTVVYSAAGTQTSDSLFGATSGDAPLVVTTTGTGLVAIVLESGPLILDVLLKRSRWVDAHATPYTPPFAAPYPPEVTLVVCQFAALDVAITLRTLNPQYTLADLRERAKGAQALLDTMKGGEPLASRPLDQTPTIAEAGAAGWSAGPGRDWENVRHEGRV